MIRIRTIFLTLILLPVVFLQISFATEEIGPRKDLFKVDDIEVVGTRKVEKEAVIEKMSLKKGMMADNYSIRKDIKKIYSLKHFSWVEVHQKTEGGKNILQVVVKEKPIVSKIEFSGNEDIDTDSLKEQVKTKEFSILDVNSLKNDVKALQKHYEDKGFFLASIDYELKNATTENVDVVFKIKEQEKVRVKKITFLGTKAFADIQLKDILETREEGFASFMTGGGAFKETNFQTDIERLKYFYKTKGYLQVNVSTPEITLSEDKRWVFISVKINEGPQFTINEITFKGELLFPEADLLTKIQLRNGSTYSEETLRQDIQSLTESYQDEGYAFANVLRTLDIVPGENKVNLEFSFEKGKIAYFGKFLVKGNLKTRDKVVRRELKIIEGEKYSGSKLRESKENVNRLGFFEKDSVVFNTITRKDKDDVLDVEIGIKERNTGQISLGAGYSTATKGFFQGSISQNNFRGLGQVLSLTLSKSSASQSVDVDFFEPYVLDTKWSGGVRTYYTSNKNESYDDLVKGVSPRIGYPIFEYTKLFFTYKLEESRVTDSPDPTVDINLENGIASSARVSIVKDKRNNVFETSKGYYLSFASEYTGLGGSKKWLSSDFEGRYFYNVVGDLVLRSRLTGTKISSVQGYDIPRNAKLSMGGPKNLRGYDFNSVGPTYYGPSKTGGISQYWQQGGQASLLGTLEFEHPLAREAGLKWVVFYDVGNVYYKNIAEGGNLNLKADYGFGFRWFSPIGVLRFEFAYPLNPGAQDTGNQFHFDIGQIF